MRKQKSPKQASPLTGSVDSLWKVNHSQVITDKHRRGSRTSINSTKSRKAVRFRDGRKGDDADADTIDESISVDSIGKGLVDVAYFETLMQDKEPWIDHNYLSGFRDIFSAGELWVQEVICIPCGLNTTYQLSAKNDQSPIFFAKKTQSFCSTWFKYLFCRSCACCRNGFKVKIFSITGTQLITFVRKSHVCASQLDIVETFYGKEEMYVGRIERSAHGYILKDKFHTDIYRVLQTPKSRRKTNRMPLEFSEGVAKDGKIGCCTSNKQEMKVFRTDTKETIGHVLYMRRGVCLRFFSGCISQPKIGFICNPDVGTNAKVLLMGVLFLLMHSGHEKYSNLPLGSDAVGYENVATSSLTTPKSISETSLDQLMNR